MLAWLFANWDAILTTALEVVGVTSVFVFGLAKAFARWPKLPQFGKLGRVLEAIYKWGSRLALNPPAR